MPHENPTRRRMIAIVATAAGSALLGSGRLARANVPVVWRGSALGAQVSIEIYHPDRAEAERLVRLCLQDVHRLEQQFSLYRTDSAVCTLNRTGVLVAPDADMVSLLYPGATHPRLDQRHATAHRRILARYVRHHLAEGAELPALEFWQQRPWVPE